MAKKGGGESYIDTSRGIAVGLGKWVLCFSTFILNIILFLMYTVRNVIKPHMKLWYFTIGAEDIKTHMDEFKEELSLGQRLTDQDILELHILIEQASHEIRQYRPEVSYEWDRNNICQI